MTNFEDQWLNKMTRCLDSAVGEEKRRRLMRGSERLTDETDSSIRIAWTKDFMDRLNREVNGNKWHDIFTGCACRHPREPLLILRKKYAETRDLPLVHAMLQKRFEEDIRSCKQLDSDQMAFIKGNDMGVAGRLESGRIVATKIPARFHEYWSVSDPEEKRIFYCHCPRVREALEKDIPLSEKYCYCGAGYYRDIWETILRLPVRVEVLESIFKGDEVCRIAVILPAAAV